MLLSEVSHYWHHRVTACHSAGKAENFSANLELVPVQLGVHRGEFRRHTHTRTRARTRTHTAHTRHTNTHHHYHKQNR